MLCCSDALQIDFMVAAGERNAESSTIVDLTKEPAVIVREVRREFRDQGRDSLELRGQEMSRC